LPLLYVIGLGGTGSKIVINFARRLRDISAEAEKKGIKLGVKYQIFDLAREPEVEEALKTGILSSDDVLIVPAYIVEQEKVFLPTLAETKKWFPQSIRHELVYRVRGEQGVERRRPVARLLLHDPQIAWLIYNEIKKDLEDLVALGRGLGMQTLYVVIVTSLGGGWGSGTFIDIAALVRHVFERIAKGALTLITFGVLILPYGYSTWPPLGLRVEFEEENAMAALRELWVLDELARTGKRYVERIGNIGDVDFTSPFDLVFVASYAGVKGGTYIEQYRNLDKAIAEFLAFLALIPSNVEELKRYSELLGKEAVGGITLSENITAIFHDVNKIVPPEDVDSPKWRPLVLTFGITEYSLMIEKLANYFSVYHSLKEMELKLAEATKKKNELEAKHDELKAEHVKALSRLTRCLEEANRMLSAGEGKIPEGVKKLIEDFTSDVERDPIGIIGRGEIGKFLERLNAEARGNKAYIYLALKKVEQEVRGLERKVLEEKARIDEELIKIDNRLTELNREYTGMGVFEKLVRGRDIKKQITSLQKTKAELSKKRESIDERLESIRAIRIAVSDAIASIVKDVRAEALCREPAEEVKKIEDQLKQLEYNITTIRSDIQAKTKIIESLKSRISDLERDPDIKSFMNVVGRETMEKLYELWKTNPEEFTRKPLAELVEYLGPRSKLFEDVKRELILSAKPTLADTQAFRKCLYEFCNKFLKGSIASESITRGVKILIATPKDAEVLAKELGGGVYTIRLEHLGSTVRLVTVYPVIPLPCTEEFKRLWEEYQMAKRGETPFYRFIHVIPVDELIEEIKKSKTTQ